MEGIVGHPGISSDPIATRREANQRRRIAIFECENGNLGRFPTLLHEDEEFLLEEIGIALDISREAALDRLSAWRRKFREQQEE
jgi:hypothetical protein